MRIVGVASLRKTLVGDRFIHLKYGTCRSCSVKFVGVASLRKTLVGDRFIHLK